MQHYINGAFVEARGKKKFHAIDPATGASLWQGCMATKEEIVSAHASSVIAHKAWAALPFSSRCDYMKRFQEEVEKNKSTLAACISQETGKPLWEAFTEVSSVIAKIPLSIEAYQERTRRQEKQHAEARAFIRYKPLGVVAVLGPYNFPAHLSNGHIVPALLAGNTVIYKPSELAPGVAECIMRCWHAAGLPPGVLNTIQGDGGVAKTLLAQDIQGVFFTGSYETGLLIHQQFKDRIHVLLALELGGNSPLIVDEVDDIPTAAYYTLLSTLLTAGQRCSCARRVYIPATSFGQAFLNYFFELCQSIAIGAYTESPEPFMGPVIRESHALAQLRRQEYCLHLGGKSLLRMQPIKSNTGFLSPGIIDMTDVENPPDIEIFAPFVQIYRYTDFARALTLANQTRFGLAAGLLSDSPQHFDLFYQEMRAGVIHWNRPTTGAASNLPFGGLGDSGNHRPSAYFASDYCATPIATLETEFLVAPSKYLPGVNHALL